MVRQVVWILPTLTIRVSLYDAEILREVSWNLTLRLMEVQTVDQNFCYFSLNVAICNKYQVPVCTYIQRNMHRGVRGCKYDLDSCILETAKLRIFKLQVFETCSSNHVFAFLFVSLLSF